MSIQLNHFYHVQMCQYLVNQALNIPWSYRAAAMPVIKLIDTNVFFSLAIWMRIIFTERDEKEWQTFMQLLQLPLHACSFSFKGRKGQGTMLPGQSAWQSPPPCHHPISLRGDKQRQLWPESAIAPGPLSIAMGIMRLCGEAAALPHTDLSQ